MIGFTERVIEIIKQIPPGKVLTYGAVAQMAGNPAGARQVSRILHSCTKKYGLPWFRILNKEGRISLEGDALKKQQHLLEEEGIRFMEAGKINLKNYLWNPLD